MSSKLGALKGLACLTILALGSPLPGQEGPARRADQELLSGILEACRDRQKQMNPHWVRFELSEFESGEWQKMFGDKSAQDRRWKIPGEYACKGAKTRTWADRRDSAVPPPRREFFVIYNGEISIMPSNEEGTYFISRKPKLDLAAGPPLSVTGEDNFYEHLKRWAEKKGELPVITTTHEKTKEGEPVLLVDLLYPKTRNWRVKCWLLPEQGHAVRRYEVHSEGRLGRKCETFAFITVNGLCYPERGRAESYGRFPSGEQYLSKSTDFTVTSLETEAKKVPDSLFQFVVPTDASLWDEDEKVFIRNTERTESHLKEVVERAGPPNLWKPWLWVGGSVALVMALTALGLRWRKRMQRSRLNPS